VDWSQDPGEREMFERLAKLLKTDRMRPWRLDQAARSIFLTEFVSAFFLAMRYFFKPKATLNYPFEKGSLSPRFRGYNSFMGYDPVNDVTLIIRTSLTISLEGKTTANTIMQKMLDQIYTVSPLQ
jgi:hypothetical protein